MTTMADVSREGILLAGAGRALLLQLAHPSVGLGVAEHSDFARNPLGRLHGTLAYIYAVAGGDEADAAAMRRAVNRAHVPVRGPGYTAMDPALQLWVAATLYQTAITIYEDVFGELGPDDAETVYRDYAVLGSALQMTEELWPVDRAAFQVYWNEQLASLTVHDHVRDVAHRLLHPRQLKLRIVMPIARFATSALLPAHVRTLFELKWSDSKQKSFDRIWGVVTWAYKQYPAGIRSAPRDYYLRKLRASS